MMGSSTQKTVGLFPGHTRKQLSGILLVCGLDDGGFQSRQGLEIFLFTTVSRPALGPTQASLKWVLGALSLGVKRPGCEADHSPPSNADVKNAWSYTSAPPVRLHGVVFSFKKKHKDNFTFLHFIIKVLHFRTQKLLRITHTHTVLQGGKNLSQKIILRG
jgi:hypothetical protein